jgi:hypothetical protein
MAFERLQAGAPFSSNSRFYRNPIWLFHFEMMFYQAAGWTKYECGCVCLKRADPYCLLKIRNESAGISNKLE